MTILYFFWHKGIMILHAKFEVILSKNKGVTEIFLNFDLILNRENQRHALMFARNDLKFFVQNLRTIMQKNYKIVIVKFCL